MISLQIWLLQLADTGTSGIDPTLFYQIISALAGAVVVLAGKLYKTERDARIKAEAQIEKFLELAPELADGVRWLVEDAQDQHGDQLPWPYQRERPRRTNRPNTRRR
jgi:hypothetical protein